MLVFMTIENVSRLISLLDWVLQNSLSRGDWHLAVLVGCDLKCSNFIPSSCTANTTPPK